jgi:uncharacterized glyoxalase superfamily protein PhnB
MHLRRALVQVTHDATAPQDPVISVAVGDGIEEAYEEATRRGFEIVHPLTREPWGELVLQIRHLSGAGCAYVRDNSGL